MIYSDHKGERLTSKELDANFRELVARLSQLEKNDFQDLGIMAIETRGDQLIFKGPQGIQLGEAQLPTLMPQFKGLWKPNTSYEIQDWVQHLNHLCVCVKAAPPSKNFDPSYWQSLEDRS